MGREARARRSHERRTNEPSKPLFDMPPTMEDRAQVTFATILLRAGMAKFKPTPKPKFITSKLHDQDPG